jgi:hypothetical protein
LETCLNNRGAAGKAWLNILVDREKREKLTAECRSVMKRFCDLHVPTLTVPQMRILDQFAIVFTMASILPAFKLVPWTKEEGEDAVTYIYKQFVRHHQSEYSNKLKVLQQLSKMTTDRKKFPRPLKVGRLSKEERDPIYGFRTKFRNKPVVCLLPLRTEALAQALSLDYKGLKSILKEQNFFVVDASGKDGFMSAFAKEKRRRYHAIHLDKLNTVVA